MVTYSGKDMIHWNYYIALENDLEILSRYIEFTKKNEKTYSIELAKILMSSSSEIDVVLKMLCKIKQLDCNNINGYRECIINNYPGIVTEKVYLNRFSMVMAPWSSWKLSSNTNPDWWKSYNNVKHERNLCFSEANLINVINSVSALLIILIYYYKEKKNLSFKDTTRLLTPHSSLMNLNIEYYNAVLITE